jgi:hypothetical protein
MWCETVRKLESAFFDCTGYSEPVPWRVRRPLLTSAFSRRTVLTY